ncbi:putative protein S-acyltransferase 11-like [Capsicum annuum]|nr:putative protein S-acyltransferase 11-like [Capsicum annuum]
MGMCYCRLYPWQLWIRWNKMDPSDHDEIFKYLGFLTNLMATNSKGDVIDALLSFWDPLNNMFCFSNFELTPTLEEITGYAGFGNMHCKRLIASKLISVKQIFYRTQGKRSIHRLLYFEWFKRRPPPTVRPEISVKGLIDQKAAIRIGIEMGMRDHHVVNQALRADLERARTALTQQQIEEYAEDEERVKQARLAMERDYQSTIQVLNADLERARTRIIEKQREFAEEKAKSAEIEEFMGKNLLALNVMWKYREQDTSDLISNRQNFTNDVSSCPSILLFSLFFLVMIGVGVFDGACQKHYIRCDAAALSFLVLVSQCLRRWNISYNTKGGRSFPLTEEEYLLRLDDVANTLKCWGAVSHIRNSLEKLKERPRIGKPVQSEGLSNYAFDLVLSYDTPQAVSIFIDMDESGGRANEWIYK